MAVEREASRSGSGPLRALVAIVGPTAVGKTQVSIEVAAALGAEIVSADSRLLYRGMDIGTAKPTPAQRSKVPHHLIDVAEPEEAWSLVRFKREANQAIADIQAGGRLPILVGGTGQYVTAILEGWAPPPAAGDESLRRMLESFAELHGPEALHHRLQAVDPTGADQIDAANIRRVARALEVFELTGAAASEVRGAEPPDYRILRIGLNQPRDVLYRRIDQRIDRMLLAGLVEEVQRLLDRGISPDHPPMSAIGYKQIAAHLRGEISMAAAVQQMRRRSRQFVRRQANWFKAGDPRIEWVEARQGVAQKLIERIRDWQAEL